MSVIDEFRNKLECFVPGKPFKPSLVFVLKAGAYPSGATKRSSPLGWALGLTHTHYSRLEWLIRDKHSSVLPMFVEIG
jgi:hypothetical protein